ncbi:hypothetical protein KBD81_00015 [Candidatus Woesebacteria bacterium]|nr:hypothetical protein [Candidatus Woesebacteria bacterium]
MGLREQLAGNLFARLPPDFTYAEIREMFAQFTEDGVDQWLSDLPQTEEMLRKLKKGEAQELYRNLKDILLNVAASLPPLQEVQEFLMTAHNCVLDPARAYDVEMNAYLHIEDPGSTRVCTLTNTRDSYSCSLSQMERVEEFPQILYVTTTRGAEVHELSIRSFDPQGKPSEYENAHTLKVALSQGGQIPLTHFNMQRLGNSKAFEIIQNSVETNSL